MNDLLKILQEINPSVDFLTHTTLIDDKIIDSFDIITLVAEISDVLGVDIPAEELVPENFNSYKNLMALINKLENEG